MTFEHLNVHFTNNGPMAIFTEASRTIEVSHWGNINVEEHFEISNEGAKVKGEWGRVDFN
jgi:oligosaccharyltransferase complex subunit alpha (ribophorin I)